MSKQHPASDSRPSLDPSPYTLPGRPASSGDDVYRAIQTELAQNNDPDLNFASFVAVSMEDEAIQLALESIHVNLADASIYKATTEIQKRIIHMAAHLLHADFEPGQANYIGSATVGSSEAVMLGVLAHKQRWLDWVEQLPSAARPRGGRTPNMVIGGNHQVCWQKAYKFFDIEGLAHYAGRSGQTGERCRIIPLEPHRRVVTAQSIRDAIASGMIDDHTICIGLILGTTLTSETDEIVEINAVLREWNNERKARANHLGLPHYRVPIHVDAAYGGFILPFTEPDFEWDFRASEVQSINLSNHKYGMVFPGLGTVVFRHSDIVPKRLFSKVN